MKKRSVRPFSAAAVLALALAASAAAWGQEQPGAYGEFFDNMDFTNRTGTRYETKPIYYRSIDTTPDTDWEATDKPEGVGLTSADTFSIRWRGMIQIDTAGDYNFYLTSDDGSRMYLVNPNTGQAELIIDGWVDQGWTTRQATRNLPVGRHLFMIEFYENGGDCGIQFEWSGPGIARQNVPMGSPTVVYAQLADPPTITTADGTEVLLLPTGGGNPVTMTTSVPGGVIWYTLDGSDPGGLVPGGTAIRYTGPVNIDVRTTIRARVYAPGYIPSDPATQFVTPLFDAVSQPSPSAQGVYYKYYYNTWGNYLPNFDVLLPEKRGLAVTADPLIGDTVWDSKCLYGRDRDTYFGFQFTGYVNIPQDGEWTFWIDSDDGSRLYIATAGTPGNWVWTQVVDWDGGHGMDAGNGRSGKIGLKAGWHPIKVLHSQGTGGFGMEVRWELPGIVPVALIPSTALCTEAPLASPVITPNGGSFVDSQLVTITAVPGATIYYTTDGTAPDENSATGGGTSPVTLTITEDTTLRVVAFIPGTVNASVTVSATFSRLNVPPDLLSVNAGGPSPFNQRVTVLFQNEVDPVTAANPANYTINNGISVTAATLLGLGASGTGVTREWWTGIGGTNVSDLTGNANYPGNPTGREILTTYFEAPTNWADNYGTRMRAYFIPPTTGTYYFFIASDDSSELRLSTNDDPANAQRIAYINGWCGSRQWLVHASAKSAPINLTQGQRYYIEALQKEGGGGDNLAVRAVLTSVPTVNGDLPLAANLCQPYVDGANRMVVLTTSALSAGVTYTLTVNNVMSRTGTPIPAGGVSMDFMYFPVTGVAGTAHRELYTGIGGGNITDLTSNVKFPNFPDLGTQIGPWRFNGIGDNYGSRVRAYFYPAVTTNYYFAVASDDASRLYLSTDQSPFNKRTVSWTNSYTGYEEYQNSNITQSGVAIGAISLNQYNSGSGYRYYIESLQKEGGGGDHVAVGVSTSNPVPSGSASTLGSSSLVGLISPIIDPLKILKHPADRVVKAGQSATFTVTVSGSATRSYQWYKDGDPIFGANSASLTIPSVAEADSGDYYVVVTNDVNTVTSNVAFLVVCDNTPPTILRVVSSGDLSEVYVTYSEYVDRQSAETPTNYTITPPQYVEAVNILSSPAPVLLPDGRTVRLHLDGDLCVGDSYTLTVSNVKDRSLPSNTILPASTYVFVPSGMPASSMTGHWKLDDGAGFIAADSTTPAENGTLINSGLTWIVGQHAGALRFGGLDGYVASSLLVPTKDMTISLWFRTSNPDPGGLFSVVDGVPGSFVTADRSLYFYDFGFGNGPELVGEVFSLSGLPVRLSTGSGLNNGAWHNVVLVLGGIQRETKLFVDGVLRSRSSVKESGFDWNTGIVIGWAIDADGIEKYFAGDIDDVRVFSRALTTQEIGALSNTNMAPVANAGPDLSAVVGVARTIVGTVPGDDGRPVPPGTTTVLWTQVAGPAAATIANPNQLSTSVTFPTQGNYILRLVVSDGEYHSCDFVNVQVAPPGTNPYVQFQLPASSGLETLTAPVEIEVTLSWPANSTVTVPFSVTGTATVNSDFTYAPLLGTLTFNPGDTLKVITLTLQDDLVIENPDETVVLTLGAPTGPAQLGTPNSHTFTILDDDGPPTVQFEVAGAQDVESVPVRTVRAVLSRPMRAGEEGYVSYGLIGGTAVAGEDFFGPSAAGTLYFPEGSDSASFDLVILDDTQDEGNETIQIGLVNPSGVVIGIGSTFTYTIIDDDKSALVYFPSKNSSAVESSGIVNIPVELSETAQEIVTVNYRVMGGTATNGIDYKLLDTGTLTFNPGDKTKNIRVQILVDAFDEFDETVTIALYNPWKVVLGDPAEHTLTITDDDEPPGVSFSTAVSGVSEKAGTVIVPVTLSTLSAKTVAVTYSITGGTATGGGTDYTELTNGVLTFQSGEMIQYIQFQINDDTLEEPAETINLSLAVDANSNALLAQPSTHVLSIYDDDTAVTVGFTPPGTGSGDESVTMVSIPVSLSAPSGNTITVPFSVGGTAAGGGVDYTISTTSPIVFQPGQTTVNVQIAVVDDVIKEPNETIILTLGTPTSSPNASGVSLGSPTVFTYTIVDNEPTPHFTVSDVVVMEGDAGTKQVTFDVTLTPPSSTGATVEWYTVNGTATAGEDYVGVTATTLDFAANQSLVQVQVTVNGDTIPEPSETFFVRLQNSSLGADSLDPLYGADPEGQCTLLNDDNTISVSNASVVEGAGTLDFTVTVTPAPAVGATISVRVDTANGTAFAPGDYTAIVNQVLTFTNGDPGPKTVSVTVINDDLYEIAETLTLILSEPQNAIISPTQGVGTGTINPDGDAAPAIAFSSASSSGAETVANPVITVTLSAPSGVDTTVDVAGSGTASGETDYTLFPPAVVATLRGYWKLDDAVIGAAQVVDSTGLNTVGSHVNMASTARDTTRLAPVTFPNPSSLRFDGSNDYVTIPDSFSLNMGNGSFTVSMWIYLTSASPKRLINKWVGGGPDYGWLFDINTREGGTAGSLGDLRFRINDDVNNSDGYVATSIVQNAWYHVAARVDRTANLLQLFVNGAPVGAPRSISNVTGSLSNTQPVGFGSIPSANGNYFSGNMDDVRIYASALADNYIAMLYSGTTRITIPAGQTSATVPFTVVNDAMDEDSETVVLTLQNPVNATLGGTSVHTYTIVDDDPEPSVAFAADTSGVTESGGTAQLAVQLSAASGWTVQVPYSVTGGTATGGGVDYTLASGTLTFAPGEYLKSISVAIINDTLNETDETVVVTLGTPTHATPGSRMVHTLTITDDDPVPTLTFRAPAASSAPEGNAGTTVIPLTVDLSTASGRDVLVDYSVGGGTATPGTDFTLGGTGTLTIPAGATSGTINLNILGDTRDEDDETVIVVLSNLRGAAPGANLAYTHTILNDGDAPPTISFVPTVAGGAEESTPVPVTIELSSPSDRTITVEYGVTGGTATNGLDFALTGTGALEFAPGETSKTVVLEIFDDLRDEDNETVILGLWNPVNGTILNGTYTYTINDDADPPPAVSFALSGSQGQESVASVSLAVNLSTASGRQVQVSYTAGGTAAGGGVDYTLGGTGTLTFLPGETTKTIPLTIVDDSIDEDNETVVVTLSSPVNAALGANSSHTYTIQDNDTAGFVVSPTSGLVTTEAGGQATFTIRLTSQPTADVTIGFSSSDLTEGTVAPASVTFNAGNWNTPQTITVTGVDADVPPNQADGNIAYTIITSPDVATADLKYRNLNPPDVSVTNMDANTRGIAVSPTAGLVTTEAGGTATFTVVLTSAPSDTVTIALSSSDTTEGTVSPASLTFTTGNWNTPQTVTVTGVDDFLDDGDIAYTIVTAPAVGGNYAGLNAADVSVTNLDDDTAGITVSPTAGLTVTEAAGASQTAAFTVVLNSQPTANVTLTVTSSDTTEGLVSIPTSTTPAASKTLTFTPANWNAAQTVTVHGQDDRLDDGDIAFLIVTSAATSSDPRYSGLNPPDVSVTNIDDDTMGITVSPTTGLTTTEAGGQATFTIVLVSQPLANVTINLSSDNPAEGTVSPATVTFTPSNWNAPRTVTVTGVNDFVADGNVVYHIVTSPAVSADPLYSGADPADVTVTNIDNDTAGIVVSPTAGLVTTEAGGSATFSVRLNSQPTSNVTIPLSSTQPGEGVPSPSTLTFTSSNWNVNQTVTVTGVDDFVDDGNVAYSISVGPAASADAGYSGRTGPSVSVTNTDNDTVGITVSPTSGLVTSENGGQATFTVVLRTQPQGTVTVSLESSDTTEGMVSPTQMTFDSGNWNIPQVATVTGLNDDFADGSQAYTIVTAVDATVPGRDPAYDAVNPPDVSVTNADNDSAGITVAPTAGLTVTEAAGPGHTASFSVVLNTQPTASVTITLTSSDTTEGTVSPASLTFTTANWATPQTVTVTGVDDFLDDGDVSFWVRTNAATSADPNYNGRNPADVQVTCLDDDTAGITVSAISGNTTEAGPGTATFTVVLDSQPTATVSINVSTSDATEGLVSIAGSTTPAASKVLTFTTADWATPKTVTVTGVNDDVDDGDVAYTIVLAPAASSDPRYSGLDAPDVAVTNVDDDTAGITVSAISGNTTEAGGTATFTVVLNSTPTADVVINLSSSNPAEGWVSPSTLTFTPANARTPRTVTVTGVDDTVDDDNVAYSIITAPAASGDPLYHGMDAADVSVLNVDNDTAGVSVFPTSGLVTTEAGGSAAFTVVLATTPLADVTIAVSVSDAREGAVSPALLTFTPATAFTPQTVTVTGVNDDVDDGNAAYTVILGPAVSADPKYAGLDPADVSVTNVDDDTAGIVVSPTSGLMTTESGAQATFTVVLSSQPTAAVTIGLSSSDPNEGTVSPPSLVFTPSNWNIPQTATVTGVDDGAVVDGNKLYTIVTAAAVSADATYNGRNPADVTVTNVDNDVKGIAVSPTTGLVTTEAGGTAQFSVVLSSQPAADVTIPLASSDTTEGTVSPAQLVFNASNWNVPQTVTVTGVNDDVDDGDIAYTIVTGQAASADPVYNGLAVPDVSVTNRDDDTAGIAVSPTTGLVTTEAGGTAQFTVVLASQPTANVSVTVTTSDATEGLVFTAASPAPAVSKTLVFTPATWNAAQTVTVRGVDDLLADGDIAYTIVTSPALSSDPRYSQLDPADVSVTNLDDDTAGFTVAPVSGLTTTEAGGQATFTVKLNSQPTASVTISLVSTRPTEGTVSPASITFSTTNWNFPRTVTVTGVNDFVDDGDAAYTIVLEPAVSADPRYNGRDPQDVTVTNLDDDTRGIVVSPTAGLTTTEAGGTATFTVKLSSQPLADVAIPLTSSNPAEGVPSPASLTFTAANWNVNQTVTLRGVDDFVDDGNVAYTVAVGPATSSDPLYLGLSGASVSATNTDNDTVGITVSPTSGLVTSEAGGQAVFTVVLRSQPAGTGTVTVNLASSNTAEGTVAPDRLVFNAANWNVPQAVTVTGVDDAVQDGSVAYTIVTTVDATVAGRDTAYDAVNPPDVSVTNADNDTAGITVAPTAGLTVTEAGGTAQFLVVLNTQPTADVTIGLASSDTTEGTVSPASLTFTTSNWSVAQVVTVTGVNDDLDDGDVVFSIRTNAAVSTDPKYNGRNPADVQVTCLDDDAAGILVSGISGPTTEAGGTATFTVRLAAAPSATVSIALSSSDPTEGAVSPSSLIFTAGNWSTPQTVTVTGRDDFERDGDVAYTIVLAPAVSLDPAFNGLDAPDVAVVNLDNDVAGFTVAPTSGLTTTEAGGSATFTVALATIPKANVTIALSVSNPAEGMVTPTLLTFTPANARTAQTVTVRGVDDLVDDGNVAYTVVLGAAVSADPDYSGLDPVDVSVTNIDNDTASIAVSPTAGLITTEAGGQATFTVVLGTQPTADVSIALSSSDPTEGTVSPAVLVFTPSDWNLPRTVTVTGVDDLLDDGNVAYTIVTAPAVSADLAYAGRNAADVSVTNVDDDTAGITVSPTSGLVTSESGGQAFFTIVLRTEPAADVTIGLSSSDTTEGTVAPASVTFTPLNWSVPQTVVVTGVDADVPPNQADGPVLYRIVTAAAVSADAAYNGRDPADVFVTNTDKDSPGITVSPISGLVTTESGGRATFTVALNSAPAADVTITLASSNAAEGTVSPASLTFTPANYNIAQTVTVTGVNDDVDDGDVVYTIRTNPAASTDPNYRYLNAADVSVTNLDDDTAGITVTPLSGNTTEAGGTAMFAIVLDTRPLANVSIMVSSSDPSEGLVSTVASPLPAASKNVVFTPSNWNTPQVVTVTGVDDPYDDGDVAYTIVLAASTSTDPKYSGINPPDFSLVNIDNDTAGIAVNPTSGLTTTEAGGTATFTVVLTARPMFDVTVGLSSSNPSEGAVSPSFLTFTSTNWSTPRTVTVRGVDDFVADGNVAYAILTAPASSADPAYNGLDPADVSVTNTDNDTAGITVTPTSGLTTTEAGGKATFTIRLNSQPRADVTLPLSSSDPTEGAVSPLAVTFTALNWSVPQTVTVTGVDDFEDDGNVAYTIVTAPAVSADTVYNGMNPADVSVMNIDDDTAGITVVPTSGLYTTESGGQATFTVVLNSRPSSPVTIGLSSSDPARGTVSPVSLVFTPLDWNVPQTVTVTGVDDGTVADGSHAYTVVTAPAVSADAAYQNLDAADVAVVNADNDTPGITVTPTAGLVTTEAGGQASFTIVLNTKPSANVTINLTSSDTTEGTLSAASAVFTPETWNTPQTITVTGVDDNEADGDVPYTIQTAAATSTDGNYNGLNPPDVAVTNRDNDTAGITVTPTSGLVTTEAGGTATFTVVLDTQPAANVTIPVSSSNTAEGTVSPASLVFTSANWNVPQTVTVTGVNDAVADGNVAYTVVLGAATSSDPRYGGANPPDVSVTNLDNDAAGIVVSSISGNTTEAGGTATFTVVLASQPSASVTVTFSSSDTTEGTVTPSVTFTPANWNVPQTVTVTGVDDTVADGNVAYTIFVEPASSADPAYDGLDGPDVSVVNTDNDTPGITVVPTAGLVTSEAGGQATFTVVLATAPAADVSIAVASSDLTEGTVSPSTLIFTPDNWNVPQTVTVTGVNDSVIDGHVAYTVVLSPAVSLDPNYSGRDPADVSVTNTDNDAAAVTVHPVNGLLTTEQGGTATFTVVLNAAPTADVTIPISSSDLTEGTVSVERLVFTPSNWDAAQVVTVTGVDDALVDGNQTYTVVTGDPTSPDAAFNALTAADVDDVTVVNIDNETPGITVSAISGHTSETGTTAYFQVVLNTVPAGNVTFDVTSLDTTEGLLSTEASPAPAATKTITFTPADALIVQFVTVIGQDDPDVDGDITYTVATGVPTSADAAYHNLNPADVSVTNDDDEEGGVVVTPTAGLVTTEAGGTATFTMVLNAQPAANVTINLASSDTTEGTVSPASVTFTPANWNVPQTVTVTGVDDAVTDGDILYTIITSNTVSADPAFNNLPVSDVSVTNIDNDVPGFTVTPTSGLVTTEAGGTATFTVRLNTLPAASVTLPLSSSNTAEGTVSPSSLTFTTANWNVPQTVTVRGVDDAIDDGNVAYTIVTGDPTSADPVYDALTADQVADVSVTNTDNDTAVVSGIRPNRGPIAGGQAVTISGTTLLGATSVVFGSVSVPAASFVSNSATEIVLLTPAQGAGGTVTVTVNFPGGAPTTTYTYVDPATTADLSVIKTANPPAPTLGENVEFSVVVSNSGQQPAGGVVVTDLLPAGLTYVTHTASQGTYTRSTGLWSVGTLAALNGSATLSVIARLDTAAPVTNTAEVTAMTSPAEGDLDSIVNNHDPSEDDQDSVTLSAALAIQTTTLPGGTVGAFYSQTLRATGGVTPYRWSVVSGSLPPGLGLIAGNGILSGTPTTAGTFAFTVQVTDSNSPQGSDTQALSITVAPAGGTPTITNAPPAGTVGVPYDFTFTAAGGTPPYRWSISGLPAGLSLDTLTGRLSGVPASAGTTTPSVTVTDLALATDTDTVTIVISPNPVTITTLVLPDGSQGSAYNQAIQAAGGILNATPWQWSVVAGAAPTGLTLSGTGRTATLSGTATAAGVFSFTVQAEDSVGTTDTQAYTVTIATAGGPLAITPMTLAPATVNRPWAAVQLTATGGAAPYTGWTVTGGNLPLGVTLSGAGVLSGTPTESGVFGFTVRVSDSSIPAAQNDTQDFSLTVNPAPAITTASPLPSGTVGNGYFQALQAVGGTAPYAWAVTAGSLPGGLSLDPATGAIHGTPSAAGTANFTVTLTDAQGAAASAAYALTIVSTAALAVVTNQLPVGEVGVPYSATLQAVGGTPPYAWSLLAGALPSWAAWDAATGTISGTPNAAGTVAGLQFQAADAAAATASSGLLSLTVRSPLLITTPALPNGSLTAPYSAALATSGEVAPVQWTLVSGSLPGGLSLDPATGAISGRPTAIGTYVFRVQATDAAGRTAQRQFTVSIVVDAGGSENNRECFMASAAERPASKGGWTALGLAAALAAAAFAVRPRRGFGRA